jgi:branched-chain amino acid transport system ATP-binding protein
MKENIILNIDSIMLDFLHKQYKQADIGKKNINLTIEKGLVTALIGGNGSGKTSLFNVISGYIKPVEGEIYFDKSENSINYQPITSLKPYKIARLGLGRMFQDNHIFHNMTVIENMLVADENTFGENPFESFLYYKKNAEIEKSRIRKVENIFDTLFSDNSKFKEKVNDKAGELSHGEQRLLGLARLLMGNYSLFLLDEPTSGVNQEINDNIKKIIRYFVEKENKSVFLIEHNMQFVLDSADFCYYMGDGLIKFKGTPEELLNNPIVRKDYVGTNDAYD